MPLGLAQPIMEGRPLGRQSGVEVVIYFPCDTPIHREEPPNQETQLPCPLREHSPLESEGPVPAEGSWS